MKHRNTEPYVHERPAGPLRAEIPLFTAALLWGLSFVFLKNALDTLPVHFILAVRFTGATLMLAPIFYRRLRRHWNRDYLVRGAVMGVFLFAAYSIQTLGLKTTDPGNNAFLTAVYVVLVPFIYWIVKGSRPDRYSVSAAFLCVAGVGLVATHAQMRLSAGDGLTLLGGLFFALHLVSVALFAQRRDPFVLTLIQFAVTALLNWAVWAVFEPMPGAWTTQAIWEVGYLTVMATTVALLLQTMGQKHTNPAPAAVLLSLEAVFGALAGVLLYGEQISPRKGLGFLLIFLSVVLSQTKLRFFRRRYAAPRSEDPDPVIQSE